MNRTDLFALVDEARRAPSVHNIQPARWALAGDHAFALHADPARRMPIADPTGHDVRVSLGAACEGMAIALARRGYTMAPPTVSGAALTGQPVARLEFERFGAPPDPLTEAVAHRTAYRGTFAKTETAALDALEARLAPAGTIMVRERDRIRDLAQLADRAMAEFLLDPRYWVETWGWIRLSRSHTGWDRDGLNAETLALSGIERVMGSVLMAPPMFETMRRMGLAGSLLSERSKIESAGAMLLFMAPQGEDPFETGRAFYRTWLEVTAGGLALCPISVLADSKTSNAEIRGAFPIPAERRLVNVFRIGAAPRGFPARLTPRLPAEELIVG